MNDELPEGWIWAHVSDVTESVPNTKPENQPEKEFGYVDITSIDNTSFTITGVKRFKGKNAPSRARRPIRPNDVLFSNVRTYLRNVALVPHGLRAELCSTGFTVLRPNRAIEPRYLFRYVLSDDFIDRVTPQQTGTHYPATSDRVVMAEQIALPPLAEQRRIVAKLEELLAKVYVCQQRLAKIPSILKRFRQSVLTAASAGRLTVDWRTSTDGSMQIPNEPQVLTRGSQVRLQRSSLAEEQGVDLPDVPSTWRWTTIGDVATLVTDGDHNPPKRVTGGVPHLTAKHVKNWSLVFEGSTFISEDDFSRVRRRYEPQAGDVIITCVGTVGRTAIVPYGLKFSPDRNLAAIRIPEQTLAPQILQYILNAQPWSDLIQNASGATAQPHLYLGDLRRLPIALMPDAEQREIVRRVEALFALAGQIEARYMKAKAQVEKLTQSILAKAFRGELVPTEAELGRREGRDYEPASVLLDRIREARKQHSPAKRGRGGKNMAKRSTARRPARNRRPLDEVLQEQGKPLTPEGLFDLAGFNEDSVDGFYEELRTLIEDGGVRENRPNGKDVTLEAVRA